MAVRRPSRKQLVSGFQWLAPGLRVKRWLILVPIGLVPVVLGVALVVQLRIVDWFDWLDNRLGPRYDLRNVAVSVPAGLVLIVLGLGLILGALVAVNRSIVGVVSPESLETLPEVIRKKRSLAQGAKIVVIGGGTGLSTLLRGLKQYSANLTAVVTMTDDGGSSGLLQKQLGGILPPGDIRNCLVALADAEPLMQQLFQYRFSTRSEKDGLDGHSFGNLLIAAMAEITGDFEQAVAKTSEILAIRGRVLPSTIESVILVGEMADGREVTGETSITKDAAAIDKIRLCPDTPAAIPAALEAIRDADIVILGPGSVFTSIVPNLLVKELARAVAETKALRCYICNVMTQKGETDGYTASDHVAAIERHVEGVLKPGERIVDYVLLNDVAPSVELRARYSEKGAEVVAADISEIERKGYRTLAGEFLSESEVVRHDSNRLAKAILKLWEDLDGLPLPRPKRRP